HFYPSETAFFVIFHKQPYIRYPQQFTFFYSSNTTSPKTLFLGKHRKTGGKTGLNQLSFCQLYCRKAIHSETLKNITRYTNSQNMGY
ncbi:hypothetical protein, partial [Parabacteroides johnsonii]